MNMLLLVAGMTAITFGIRYAMFAASGRFVFPQAFSRVLHYVPPAVLSAIILPTVLMPDGKTLDLSPTSPHLIGAVVAVIVGRLTGKLLLVIVAGMAAFWIARLFLG